jgi:hypothetical protein
MTGTVTPPPEPAAPPLAFRLDPTLQDMARLARKLGCQDRNTFVGAVLFAMGGKGNPFMLQKVWEDTSP